MATYTINKGYDNQRKVEADSFKTNGDFVDFSRDGDGGPDVTVLRLRAVMVQNVELDEGA
jgi:hypothetical protein